MLFGEIALRITIVVIIITRKHATLFPIQYILQNMLCRYTTDNNVKYVDALYVRCVVKLFFMFTKCDPTYIIKSQLITQRM